MESCREAFDGMGRLTALDSEPELLAVFYSPLLFNPSILTGEYVDGNLDITVYTARSFTVGWNAAHAFRQWRRRMPEGIRERELLKKRQGRRKAKAQNRSSARPEPETAAASGPDAGQAEAWEDESIPADSEEWNEEGAFPPEENAEWEEEE